MEQNTEEEQPQTVDSDSMRKTSITDEYTRTFQMLLEEKEAIIEGLIEENQRLFQLQNEREKESESEEKKEMTLIKPILSPKFLNISPSPSPSLIRNREIDYKRLFELEVRVQELENENARLRLQKPSIPERKLSIALGGGSDEETKAQKDEIKGLKEKIKKLSQENLVMSRRLESVKNEGDENNAIEEISKLKGKLSQMKFQEEQNKQEILRLSQLNNPNNNSLLEQSSLLSSSGGRTKKELELLRNINAELEGKITMLTNENAVLSHQIESLSSVNRRIIEDNDCEFVEQLKSRILELESQIFGLEEQNMGVKKAKNALEGEIVSLRGVLEVEKAEKVREIERLSMLNSEMGRKIEELGNADRKKIEVLGEINELRGVIANLKADKTRVSEELKAENKGLYGRIEELSERCQALEGSLVQIQGESSIAMEELRMCESESRAKDEKIEILQEEISELINRIESVEAHSAEQEVIIKDLELQLRDFNVQSQAINVEKEDVIAQIRALKEENLSNAEKYNDLINLKDCHLKLLKETFGDQIKELALKVSKNPSIDFSKALESLKENSFVVTQKEAVIKKAKEKCRGLANELKELKEKYNNLVQSTQKVNKRSVSNYNSMNVSSNNNANSTQNSEHFLIITRLESQIQSQRLEIKKLEQELNFRRELIENSEARLGDKEREFCQLRERIASLEREISETRKNHKGEINELMAQKQALYLEKQGMKQGVEKDNEEFERLMMNLQEADKALTQSREDILRKNATIQNLKQEVQSLQNQLSASESKTTSLNDELEKLRKAQKELLRKDQSLKAFQAKLDSLKDSESKLSQERNTLNARLNSLKTDLQRKEAFNNELKEKLDKALQKCESIPGRESETEKLREMVKRLKSESERKETALGLLRGKLDESLLELASLKNSAAKAQSTMESEKETHSNGRKLEITKQALRKSEETSHLLIYLLKRLFNENYTHLKKSKARSQNSGSNNYSGGHNSTTLLSDSLNILKLSPQELNEFLNPGESHEDWTLRRFEEEIGKENLNVNEIYGMLNNIIEQRMKMKG